MGNIGQLFFSVLYVIPSCFKNLLNNKIFAFIHSIKYFNQHIISIKL